MTQLSFKDAESKSVVIGVTRNGGLRATYYKTISFFNSIQSSATYYHLGKDPMSYTQIDPIVDIDSGYLSAVPGMSSQYFLIVWEGQLQVPSSGEFRFRVGIVNFSAIKFILSSQTLISLDSLLWFMDQISTTQTLTSSKAQRTIWSWNTLQKKEKLD